MRSLTKKKITREREILEWKNTMTELKNSTKSIKIRLIQALEKNSELQYQSFEII